MTVITREAIEQHRSAGPWRELEAIAQELTADARANGGSFFNPILGGGTRLMLALEHRISDDIDLFIDSPGWLPYVSPRTNDSYESKLRGYVEDGDHVKWRFECGEIDFIVRTSLLSAADLWNPPAEETQFELEPVLEVLAKKLFYRGWALTPRDLFDWHAIETMTPITPSQRHELAWLLRDKFDDIGIALQRMPQKQLVVLAWNGIRACDTKSLPQVLEWAHHCLRQYKALACQTPVVQSKPKGHGPKTS